MKGFVSRSCAVTMPDVCQAAQTAATRDIAPIQLNFNGSNFALVASSSGAKDAPDCTRPKYAPSRGATAEKCCIIRTPPAPGMDCTMIFGEPGM